MHKFVSILKICDIMQKISKKFWEDIVFEPIKK